MELKTAPFSGATTRRSLAVATLALSVALSPAAIAGTPPARDCDDVARELKSLDTPVQTLAVETVDHGPIDADAESAAAVDAASPAATPLLRLAPRVSSALQEIFESDAEFAGDQKLPEPSGSPLAEFEETANEIELDESVDSGLASEEEFPLLKRKMYRIDI